MTLTETVAAIEAALQTVPGLSVYTEVSTSPSTPAIYIGPPVLSWTVFNAVQPDQATFTLYLVVTSDAYSVANLEKILPQVVAALDGNSQWALTPSASPSAWTAGGASLPAYALNLEANL